MNSLRLNVAIRIERVQSVIRKIPSIADSSKEYQDKIGRPWSQSDDLAVWYVGKNGTSPNWFTRLISQPCDDFDKYLFEAILFPFSSQPDHCGLSVAIKIKKGSEVIGLDGQDQKKYVFMPSTDVVTTIFDYDLIKRLAAEEARDEKSQK